MLLDRREFRTRSMSAVDGNRSIDRRALLLTGTVGALVSFSPGHLSAVAQPASAGANPGHYRFRIGEITATVVSDGTLTGPPRIDARDAHAEHLNRTLADAFLPSDRFVLNLNTLLLEVGSRKVLIDVGAGQTMGAERRTG